MKAHVFHHAPFMPACLVLLKIWNQKLISKPSTYTWKERYLFKKGLKCTLSILKIIMLTNFTLLGQPESPCSCTVQQTIGTTGQETLYGTLFPFSSSRCYFVKGILVIDEEVTWDGMRIEMEEGAEIRVTNGLSVYNSYISGCDVMWKGIKVENDIDIFIYNSYIQSAGIGIYLTANHPGIICRYAKFVDNFIGIGAGSPFEVDPSPKTTSRCEIYGCEFYTDANLPDPYPGHYYYPEWPTSPAQIPYNQGYAAIYANRMTGFSVGFVGATAGDRNSIHNMRNGIILLNSPVNISGTDFYDFEGTQTRNPGDPVLDLNQFAIHSYRGMSTISDNTINNVMVGVFAEESQNSILENEFTIYNTQPDRSLSRGISILRPQTLSIKNNSIIDGWRGILLENVTTSFDIVSNILTRNISGGPNAGIFIRNQSFSSNEHGSIKGNTVNIIDGSVALGIYLIETDNLIIDNNNINCTEAEGIGFQHRGIGILNSNRTKILRNDVLADESYISENSHGINFEFSSFSTAICNTSENFWVNMNINGPNNLTNLISNSIWDGRTGLQLVSPSMIGTQDHHQNKWLGDYTSTDEFGAFILGTNPVATALLSIFIVDSQNDMDYLPNPIGPTSVQNGVWFINESATFQGVSCGSNFTIPTPIPDTIAKLIRTPLAFSEFNDEMIWMMKADAFEEILLDQSLLANSVLDSFFEAEETTVLGNLVSWESELSSRFGVQKAIKEATQDTMLYLSDDIGYIDSILATHPHDSIAWLTLRAFKVDSLSNETTEWIDLLDEELTESNATYADIAEGLINLTTTNDMEEYLRQALLLKTDYLLTNSLTEGDSSDLVDLSSLCLWLGGRAISVAQEVYSTIADSIILVSSENCPSPSPFMGNPVTLNPMAGEKLSIFPNPGNDLIEIRSETKMKEIIIMNQTQEAIATFVPLSNSFAFDMQNYPPGIYFANITTEDGFTILRFILAE